MRILKFSITATTAAICLFVLFGNPTAASAITVNSGWRSCFREQMRSVPWEGWSRASKLEVQRTTRSHERRVAEVAHRRSNQRGSKERQRQIHAPVQGKAL
jgi:hypothetical protein